jgi:hypothetical protein
MSHWYVITRAVPRAEWHEVTDTETGRAIPEPIWPKIIGLLPAFEVIERHKYVGQHNVSYLPGRMAPAFDKLSADVLEVARQPGTRH